MNEAHHLVLCRAQVSAAAMAALLWATSAPRTVAEPPSREVAPGYSTTRLIPGVPYGLAGKRIVFTNWNFIQPGDLDWVNAQGKSVYVHGNEDMYAARHVGKEAPFGIRIIARKPRVVGPLQRPHRCILQDGNRYLGWTDNEFFESSDGMAWAKKANLKLDREKDGIYDGQNWYWVPGGDLLETAEYGQWNGGCIWAEPNLIELPNGDWALPYSAHNVPHKYPRGQRIGARGKPTQLSVGGNASATCRAGDRAA